MTFTSSSRHAVGALLLGVQHPGISLGSQCVAYLDLASPMVPLFFYTDVTGTWFSGPISVGASPSLTGMEIGLQAGVEDLPTAPLGVALSNGVWVTIGN